MGVLGPNGQPVEQVVQVLVEFRPQTGRVNVQAPVPANVVVEVLLAAVKVIALTALQQASEKKSSIVVPELVPPEV